jgi:cAMP-dependent protein kinase regulator
MSSESKLPEPSAYQRRGRRQTVCAAPITIEAGWMPTVVPKSDAARARIHEVISTNILFSGLDKRERDVIVDAMEPKEFAADATIIRQGDNGDFFYVVDSGHCEIFVDGVGKVLDVGPGGSFGELALMYNAPRAATVNTTEPTKTWALDQIAFKKTLMDATMKKRKRFEGFIRSVALLSTLNEYERLILADALTSCSYAAGEVILREGEPGHEFYIVEDGEVKATKEGVAGEVSRRLTSGDYFGERALLTNEPRAATITAVTPVVAQKLDRATFKRLLGPLEDVMRSNMEVYERYADAIPSEPIVEPEEKEEEDDDDDDAEEGKE